MNRSGRLYHCCRCHAQVIICSACDRGHRYCTQGCAAVARSVSQKRARHKYQSTRTGRFNNARRQQRYRERHKQKVTHQGSPPVASHDVLKNKRIRFEKAEQQAPMGAIDFVTTAERFVSLFYARIFYIKAGFYVDSGIN